MSTEPTMTTTHQRDYSQRFYDGWSAVTDSSAATVVPFIIDLVHPRSVVDVGCGSGSWLGEFAGRGVAVKGIDGWWVDATRLQFPAEAFEVHDLRTPLALDAGYDLAISLEVGEHLPDASAEMFVESLTRAAPVVVFSAAVPGQGGADHLNEQWPAYWIDLFRRNGFVAVDAIRPEFWEDERVGWFYRQNMIVFCRESQLAAHERLARIHEESGGRVPPLVHPECFANVVAKATVRGLAKDRALSALAATAAGVRRLRSSAGPGS
jgi:SAM-dependent methyltransferase